MSDSATWTIATHCYICGLALQDPIDRDHVPPRRVFPTAIRAALRQPLLTVPTHRACQQAFARDEEYFYNTLLPNAMPSSVGHLLAADFSDLIRRDSVAERLSKTVYRQFEERPRGIILPRGLIVQRVLANRIYNVVWKITRGLFAHHTGRLLPESTPRTIEQYGPFDRDRPDHLEYMFSLEPHGHSQNCFAYSFTTYTNSDDDVFVHLWCLVFWESWSFFVAFHAPDCACLKCSPVDTSGAQV